jgi:hypothetical protein
MNVCLSAPDRVRDDLGFPMAREIVALYHNPGLKPGAKNMSPLRGENGIVIVHGLKKNVAKNILLSGV